MVDVSNKEITSRVAVARGSIYMRSETLERIRGGKVRSMVANFEKVFFLSSIFDLPGP